MMESIDNIPDAQGKRAEILQRAMEIFYKQGFHATGVDSVLANTGISKRTLYKYFRSKEELIASVVAHYQTTLFEKIPAALSARSASPVQQILALFDLKADEFAVGDYSGCFAINAKLEFEGKDSAIEAACSRFYTLLEEFVAGLCTQAGCRNSAATARQIMILFEGGIVLGQIHHDPSTPNMARKMAEVILQSDIKG